MIYWIYFSSPDEIPKLISHIIRVKGPEIVIVWFLPPWRLKCNTKILGNFEKILMVLLRVHQADKLYMYSYIEKECFHQN